LDRLLSREPKVVFLLCEREAGTGFDVLKVPASYIPENLGRLSVSADRLHVRLHLSARSGDFLQDLRGKGNVRSAQWLVSSKS